MWRGSGEVGLPKRRAQCAGLRPCRQRARPTKSCAAWLCRTHTEATARALIQDQSALMVELAPSHSRLDHQIYRRLTPE